MRWYVGRCRGCRDPQKSEAKYSGEGRRANRRKEQRLAKKAQKLAIQRSSSDTVSQGVVSAEVLDAELLAHSLESKPIERAILPVPSGNVV